MALKDRLQSQGDAAKPAAFTCPHYDPQPGSKRCRSYLDRGACALPGEFMCREWMRANNQGPTTLQPPVPAPAPESREPKRPTEPARDLFGHPVPSAPQPAPTPAKAKPEPPKPPATPTEARGTEVETDPLRGLTTEDLESFRALGVEVCLRSEALGEVWLVPERTGQTRKEITPELAATIVRVSSAFPGARVVALNSTRKSVSTGAVEAER